MSTNIDVSWPGLAAIGEPERYIVDTYRRGNKYMVKVTDTHTGKKYESAEHHSRFIARQQCIKQIREDYSNDS